MGSHDAVDKDPPLLLEGADRVEGRVPEGAGLVIDLMPEPAQSRLDICDLLIPVAFGD
jgi:hypothetical protein